ncbi:SCO family protein [bacterium]|nr:SCO family protein [bacterium]
MRIYFLLFVLIWSGCSKSETHDMAEHDMATHDAAGMVLDAETPVLGDHSLYQVESSWTNQSGSTLSLSSLAGKPQVVAMTYTSCEVSCPRIVSAMQQIQRSAKSDVGFVLISIDPDRDTEQKLLAYADRMGLDPASWNLLTGDGDDVREMAALLGVRYQQMPDGEFAHSNIITVLDGEGVISHQQNEIASDLTSQTIEAVKSVVRAEGGLN